MKSAWVVTL